MAPMAMNDLVATALVVLWRLRGGLAEIQWGSEIINDEDTNTRLKTRIQSWRRARMRMRGRRRRNRNGRKGTRMTMVCGRNWRLSRLPSVR